MQIKLYYAEILDHSNNPVLTLDYTASSKHAAVIGKQYVDNCPPANTFRVKMKLVETSVLCKFMNNKRE
jgi:hypothetical protein